MIASKYLNQALKFYHFFSHETHAERATEVSPKSYLFILGSNEIKSVIAFPENSFSFNSNAANCLRKPYQFFNNVFYYCQ